MAKYLSPWALEVMQRHPEISLCDHRRSVKEHGNGFHEKRWQCDNVHVSGARGKLLGNPVENLDRTR